MSIFDNHILPWALHLMMSTDRFAKLRKKYIPRVSGKTLELGFGSGLNLKYYKGIQDLHIIEPSKTSVRLGRAAAKKLGIELHHVGNDAETIEMEDGSVDSVVSTWTLCTIPNVSKALSEVYRVLKPGGSFHFIEHGLSNEKNVIKWQNRLTPLHKKIGGGCHLNRDIRKLIDAAGFPLIGMDNFYAGRPHTATYTYAGVAKKLMD